MSGGCPALLRAVSENQYAAVHLDADLHRLAVAEDRGELCTILLLKSIEYAAHEFEIVFEIVNVDVLILARASERTEPVHERPGIRPLECARLSGDDPLHDPGGFKT